MRRGTKRKYKGYIIFLNQYGEYCACCNDKYYQMITCNASFETEIQAEKWIDEIIKERREHHVKKFIK